MAASDHKSTILRTGSRTLVLGGVPRIMGIVNVTPDSFSDGGRYLEPGDAIDHGLRLADEGADLLDLGAESTRPGAAPVDEERELARLLPVLRGLRRRLDLPISIDTYKGRVAGICLQEGADMINDISGLTFDRSLAAAVAESKAGLCLMHTPGPPSTMQERADYRDVVAEVVESLAGSVDRADEAGIGRERLLVDPGLGFGKKPEHNWELLRNLDAIHALGLPVLVGASRKSFVGLALAAGSGTDGGEEGGTPLPVEERLEGSLAVALWCALRHIAVVRVHDVDATVKVLKIIEKLGN